MVTNINMQEIKKRDYELYLLLSSNKKQPIINKDKVNANIKFIKQEFNISEIILFIRELQTYIK